MKTHDIDEAAYAEIMGRIHAVTNTRTQMELAAFLGVRQSSVSDAKRRRSIPADWLLKFYWEKMVNPQWIMTGEGSVRISQSDDDGFPESLPAGVAGGIKMYSSQELFNELVRRALSK